MIVDDADRILAADLSGLVPEPLDSDDLSRLSGGQPADERSLPIRLTHTPTRDRFCVYNG